MKKIISLAIALAAVVAFADGNVPTNTPLATPVAVTSNAAATQCFGAPAAAGSQSTATATAQPGQYFYVTYISIQAGAIAAPSATLLAITSTNIPGTPTWNIAAPAAVFNTEYDISFPVPLKSIQPGVATVVTGNAGVASISQANKICGFYAP